jgi:two-component system CheB/CheR fusion protein
MSNDSTQMSDETTPLPDDADDTLDVAQPGDDAFPIVGIGASAGGLEAFRQLLDELPADTGMAFVLIQHLDPKHESKLVELLEKVSSMPIHEATEGVPVAANQVYVIPPGTNMAIESGRLRLTPRGDRRGLHLPLDFFFRSLADDRHAKVIGVVLSGTGSDGTLGLSEIKAAGGLTFAQDEESARYSGMPLSAVRSGMVDFVLTPEEIARELARIGRHPYLAPSKPAGVPQSRDEDGEPFGKILRLLRSAFGVDFSQYRKTTIRRRIMRRMVLHPLETLADYARQLESDRPELEALFEDILINVTSFFRDPAMFEALAGYVFPAILKSKSSGTPFRIWTAGCSTGQEAYSMAMALTEFLEDKSGAPEIQVFATDLSDAGSLAKARAGHYPESIEGELSPERLRRFFRKENGGYRIVKSIRDMCVFAKQNIAQDPPFSRLDMISCRNVLIYMSSPLQQRIIPTFHYALNPGGFLLLGTSETVAGFSDLFEVVDKQHKVYLRKAHAQRVYPHFSADRYVPRTNMDNESLEPLPTLSDWQKEADRVIVGQYAPVGVLVNDRLEVLQFRGRTSHYLEPASGEANFNLLSMAREGLFGELRHSISEARKTNETVFRPGVRVNNDGHIRIVDLKVIPLQLSSAAEPSFLVLFEEPEPSDGTRRQGARRNPERVAPISGTPRRRMFGRLFAGSAGRVREPGPAAAHANEELEQLRRELSATRDHQQSILEQHEATNEELRSANEEVLSSNEELQSTNEELETSKEELQSLNEELTTVNEQLQNRNLELNQMNNDLTNFFGSTQIPLLMLGNDLRLRRFTPAAEKVLNLHAADLGRPIGDIKVSADVPDLEALVVEVLDTMHLRESEIKDRKGRWHTLRIRPYRTAENKIEGAVVALLEIDEVKRAQERLRELADYAEAIVSTVREPLLVLDGDLRVQSANASFFRTFKVSREDTENRLFYELGDGQWNVPKLKSVLEEILPGDTTVESFVVEHEFPDIGPKTILLNARRLEQPDGKVASILLALEDVTEQRRLEREQIAMLAREHAINEQLRDSEGRYHHMVQSLPAALYTCDAEGYVTLYNDAAVALWDREPEIDKDLRCGSWRIYRPDGTALPIDEYPMALAINEGRAVRDEIVIERPDGSRVNVVAHATPTRNASGAVTGAINLLMDNSPQKQSEEAQAHLAAIVESTDDAIISKDLDGTIRTWNRGAEKIFGYRAEETIGKPITLIVPQDRQDEEKQILEILHRGERVYHNETVRIGKDGRRIDVSLTISPVYNEAGQIVGASKIARDITERNQATEALRNADRRKDEFLAMLAHELRNPLAAVSSAVDLLGMPGGEKHLDSGLKIIGRQTRHLVRLVDDLLDISRITRGIVTLRKSIIDAAAAIDRAIETISPIIEARRHELEVSISKRPMWLEGDATRLEQMIANLLANAARYTDAGGHILLKAERKKNTITITVRDDGIGISTELLPYVFELFSQSERSSDRAAGGLGIGLTLVKSLVKMHGGSVEAKSDGLGKGSEFILRLPAMKGAVRKRSQAPSEAPEAPNAPRNVLVVDDNHDAALLLAHLLEAAGHKVEKAYDGLAALAAARANRPDVVLLDIGLPGQDGYEVAKQMRQDPALSDVLLIAISGYCQDEDRERSQNAGFDHHLAKPPDHQELLRLLAEAPPGDRAGM